MLGQNAITYHQINQFYADKVQIHRMEVQKSIGLIAELVKDILKGVEALEPRFISTLTQTNGRYEGLHVHSPKEFEVILYLNQMGVFNFVDDGSTPGYAVLKLSDGRKRSMSLWVEFITASGYLSARKIRSRFQTLVAQTIEKAAFRDKCKLLTESSNVRILIYGEYVVQITCAFKCSGIWPRSANQWPNSSLQWPNPELVKDVRMEGFDLLSTEIFPQISTNSSGSQCEKKLLLAIPSISSPTAKTGVLATTATMTATTTTTTTNTEGDAWAMNMENAERVLLAHRNISRAFSILKTLRDKHLEFPGTATTNYILRTLVLWECEKHANDQEWHDYCLSDRIIDAHSIGQLSQLSLASPLLPSST